MKVLSLLLFRTLKAAQVKLQCVDVRHSEIRNNLQHRIHRSYYELACDLVRNLERRF